MGGAAAHQPVAGRPVRGGPGGARRDPAAGRVLVQGGRCSRPPSRPPGTARAGRRGCCSARDCSPPWSPGCTPPGPTASWCWVRWRRRWPPPPNPNGEGVRYRLPGAMTWPLLGAGGADGAAGPGAAAPAGAAVRRPRRALTAFTGSILSLAGVGWALSAPQLGARDVADALPPRVRALLRDGFRIDALQDRLVVRPVLGAGPGRRGGRPGRRRRLRARAWRVRSAGPASACAGPGPGWSPTTWPGWWRVGRGRAGRGVGVMAR